MKVAAGSAPVRCMAYRSTDSILPASWGLWTGQWFLPLCRPGSSWAEDCGIGLYILDA